MSEKVKNCCPCACLCEPAKADVCVQGGYSHWRASNVYSVAKPRFPDPVEVASDEVPAPDLQQVQT